MNPYGLRSFQILNMNDSASGRSEAVPTFPVLALNHHPDGTRPLDPLPLNLYHVQYRELLSV